MAASTIGQLPELVVVTGNEEIPVETDGSNFKVKLDKVKTLVNKTDVGLGQVDNTSDSDKPVSTATQQALNQKANSVHGHAVSDISGFQTAVDARVAAGITGKADTGHTHDVSNIQGLPEALTGKADKVHTHTKSEITGLDADLVSLQQQINQRSVAGHGHNIGEINGLVEALQSAALTEHHHPVEDINGLQEFIEGVVSEMSPPSDVTVGALEW